MPVQLQAKKRVKKEMKATGNVVNIAKAHLGMSVRTESATNGNSNGASSSSGDVADNPSADQQRVRFEDDKGTSSEIKSKHEAVIKGGMSVAKAAAGVVAAGGFSVAAALVHKDNEHAAEAAAAAEQEICVAVEAKQAEVQAAVEECAAFEEELASERGAAERWAQEGPVPRDPYGRPRPIVEQVISLARTSATLARTSATLARTSATLARSSIRSAVSGTSQSDGEGKEAGPSAERRGKRPLGRMFRRGNT